MELDLYGHISDSISPPPLSLSLSLSLPLSSCTRGAFRTTFSINLDENRASWKAREKCARRRARCLKLRSCIIDENNPTGATDSRLRPNAGCASNYVVPCAPVTVLISPIDLLSCSLQAALLNITRRACTYFRAASARSRESYRIGETHRSKIWRIVGCTSQSRYEFYRSSRSRTTSGRRRNPRIEGDAREWPMRSGESAVIPSARTRAHLRLADHQSTLAFR